jgi:hypothetical protein
MSEATTAAGSWIPPRYVSVPNLRDAFLSRYWQRRRRNPELAKALSFVHRYSAEARNFLELDDGHAPLRTANVSERFQQLLSRDLEKLSIDEAWELANSLKRELLLIADVPYVWAQLEYEGRRDKKPNSGTAGASTFRRGSRASSSKRGKSPAATAASMSQRISMLSARSRNSMTRVLRKDWSAAHVPHRNVAI